MKAWIDWFSSLGKAVVDAGNPFGPSARRISSTGHVSNTPDGVPATGYSIIDADSLDAATTMAKSCPQLQSGGEVNVYETFSVLERSWRDAAQRWETGTVLFRLQGLRSAMAATRQGLCA